MKNYNNFIKIDKNKLETALFIIISSGVTKIEDISKVFYLSDFNHLEKYGRTITGIKYQKNGKSVISQDILEMINQHPHNFTIDENLDIKSNGSIDLDELSQSDITELYHYLNNKEDLNTPLNDNKINFDLIKEGKTIDYYEIIMKMDNNKDLLGYLNNRH